MTAEVLRPATGADAELLWQWANDRTVRDHAFHSEPIAWTTHQHWLAAKLHDPGCRIWILENDGQPVGQIRYERDGEVVEISLSVAAACRGRGFGRQLLALSRAIACRELGVARVRGVVKSTNHASQRLFAGMGFRLLESTTRCEAPYVIFEWAHGE